MIAEPPEQLKPIHTGHFYIKHGQIRGIIAQRPQRSLAVAVDARPKSFCLQANRDRCEDVPIIINQGDRSVH